MFDLMLNPDPKELETANAIFSGSACQHYVAPMTAHHSIKTVLKGEAVWTVEGRSLAVRPGRTLTVAGGSRYSLAIESDSPVVTCCVFFAPGYLEHVGHSGCSLDPAGANCEVDLATRYDSMDMHRGIERVWRCLSAGENIEAECAMIDLAADALQLSERQAMEKSRINVSRSSTRIELYRRLNLARDYMLDELGNALSVQAAAHVAMMSPYHFHRLFRECFGATVSGFIREHRLQLAESLLRRTSRPVLEISMDVGYESPTSFARAFERRFGRSPRAHRAQFRKIGAD